MTKEGLEPLIHQDNDVTYNRVLQEIMDVLFDSRTHLSPVKTPQKVLDVGCGAGVWATTFARRHPSSQVTGVDIGAVPDTSKFPSNFHYISVDLEAPWHFPGAQVGAFDLIYMRGLVGSVEDWPGLLQKCWEALRPGGWLEIVDVSFTSASQDGSLNTGSSSILHFEKLAVRFTQKINRDAEIMPHLGHIMSRAGYSGIVETIKPLPYNEAWVEDPALKKTARLAAIMYEIENLKVRDALVGQEFGMPFVEAENARIDAKREMDDARVHAFRQVYVFCGFKPETSLG